MVPDPFLVLAELKARAQLESPEPNVRICWSLNLANTLPEICSSFLPDNIPYYRLVARFGFETLELLGGLCWEHRKNWPQIRPRPIACPLFHF